MDKRVILNKLRKGIYKRVIGIDPDVDKSGYAGVGIEDKDVFQCQTMDIADLMWTISALGRDTDTARTTLYVVEGGWLNKGNWHLTRYDSVRSAAKKGYDVGRNHQVGHTIVELCKLYGMDVLVAEPLQKIWDSHDGKITVRELSEIIKQGNPENELPKPCSQDMRDALLLAWHYAGTPIKKPRRVIERNTKKGGK